MRQKEMRTAALGAGLNVNGENALQALHPNLLLADKVVKRVKAGPVLWVFRRALRA